MPEVNSPSEIADNARRAADRRQETKHARAQVRAVRELIRRAKEVSPSDRMVVYVGDLEAALGDRQDRARTKVGGPAKEGGDG